MVKLNLSEESTGHLVDMYEARIEALQKNIKKLKLIIDDSSNNEHLKETLDLLYTLEEYFEYNKTELGLRIGTLINKLQIENKTTI